MRAAGGEKVMRSIEWKGDFQIIIPPSSSSINFWFVDRIDRLKGEKD